MDTSALKEDLHKALDRLPQGMINEAEVANWINKWRPKLEAIVPDIIELLKRHVMAAMFEAGMTGGDSIKDEIEAACIEVLMSRGLGKIAQAGQTG